MTKYAENQKKASKAYYDRKKQKKKDIDTAELLSYLLNLPDELLASFWPESKQLLERFRK